MATRAGDSAAPRSVGRGVLVRRLGSGDPNAPDAPLVAIGLLAYHLIVGALVGLAGRYDITVAAILTAIALGTVRISV